MPVKIAGVHPFLPSMVQDSNARSMEKLANCPSFYYGTAQRIVMAGLIVVIFLITSPQICSECTLHIIIQCIQLYIAYLLMNLFLSQVSVIYEVFQTFHSTTPRVSCASMEILSYQDQVFVMEYSTALIYQMNVCAKIHVQEYALK